MYRRWEQLKSKGFISIGLDSQLMKSQETQIYASYRTPLFLYMPNTVQKKKDKNVLEIL